MCTILTKQRIIGAQRDGRNSYLDDLMSAQVVLMVQRFQVIVPPCYDATDPGVDVQDHQERNEEGSHTGEDDVAAVLIVAAPLVLVPVFVVPEG